jgi:hypothetical protein
MFETDHYFQYNKVMCRPNFFFQKNGVVEFGGLNWIFLMILNELIINV